MCDRSKERVADETRDLRLEEDSQLTLAAPPGGTSGLPNGFCLARLADSRRSSWPD